jgi:hypothetical protein
MGRKFAEVALGGLIGFGILVSSCPLKAQESPAPPVSSPLDPPTAPPGVSPKDAVPSDVDYKAFEARLKSIFAQEYVSYDAKAKLSLAEKLCELGRSTSSPSEKYVILREAQKAFWDGGELLQGLTVLENLANSYSIEPKIVIDAISAAKSKVKKPEDASRLCEYALGYGEKIAKGRKFDDAEKLLNHARDLANIAKDKGLQSRASDVLAMIPDIKRLCSEFEKAEAAYNLNPNDTKANETIGIYHCFIIGDWGKGLAYLSKVEGPIKTAINQEKRSTGEPLTMMFAGDKWYNLGKQSVSKLNRNGFYERARFWYEKALPTCDGIVKAEIEKKLSEMGPKIGDNEGWINLMPLIDPQRDSLNGKWTRKGDKLLCEPSESQDVHLRMEIPYQPPIEYDFQIAFTRTDGKDAIQQIISTSNKQFLWGMGWHGSKYCAFDKFGSKGADSNPTTRQLNIHSGRMYISKVEVRNDYLNAYLDNKIIATIKKLNAGDFGELLLWPFWRLHHNDTIGIGSANNTVIYHQIVIREITGKGKRLR